MLSKEQRKEIAQKVYHKAVATNGTLVKKYDEKVLLALAYKRADAVISALNRAVNTAYSEVTDAQLLDAQRKLLASKSGNREERRQAKVEANRAARAAAAAVRKQLRVEERKAAALAKRQAKNEVGSD